MLIGLRIQNYKSWADTEQIRFAPLTGFFGTNSSGKSAILQVLLLIKQTVETSDRSRILHTGGDQYSYVDVGTFYDIIHKKDTSKVMSFSFNWIPEDLGKHLWPYLEEKFLKFNCTFRGNQSKLTLDNFDYIIQTKNGQFRFGVYSDAENFDTDIEFFLLSEGDLLPKEYQSEQLKLVIEKCYNFRSDETFFEDDILLEILPYFENLFENSHYLAPLRAFPQRTYLWTGERPNNVGKTGELTIPVLLATNDEVRANVGTALKDLGLIHDFSLKPIAEGRREHELLVQIHSNSTFVPITDVGFGVSQVLPVLVLLNYVPEGSTIILEQPEIHLHPAVQAELADVLIKAIKTRNLQIIIESHSEHLLHRLQRRIAEETFTNDQAALYFCEADDEGVSHLKELKVDEYGNITNYPPKFFGDVMGDLVAMTEAAMKRRKATRKNGKS